MELVGKKFGDLIVLKKTNEREKCNGEYKYKCRCKCGKIILVRKSNLKSGGTKCCGCERKGARKTRSKNVRLYNIYNSMIARCYNKNNLEYKNYGLRGIKVCKEWKDNYDNFYNWAIDNGYKEELTIDRINNDGIYEPNNCRWATREEQANNKTTSRFITYKGKTKTLSQWAKYLNMDSQKLKYRLDNWDIEKAFNK